MFTLTNFYTLLKSAVRFSSNLHTFAVLNSMSDLNSPNLGKVIQDFSRPYFYSRAWEASSYNASKISFSYPGIFVIETGKTYHFNSTSQGTIDVNLEISAIAKYEAGLIPQDLEIETSQMLQQLIHYLKGVKAYSINNSVVYLHHLHRQFLIDQGEITHAPESPSHTSAYEQTLRKLTLQPVRGFTLALGSDDLYGSFLQTTITETVPCNFPTPQWELYDDHLKDLGCEC